MKNWNTPEVIDVDIKETANGFPWWHKEYVDLLGGTTLGQVNHAPASNGEQEGQIKGEDENTSSTGDKTTNGLS